MGNTKFISWEGTPRVTGTWLDDWSEQRIADVAHASCVAVTVKAAGVYGVANEPPYVLGIAYTFSMSGGDLVAWLHEHLRSGRVWFVDLDWPDRRSWFNNNDGRGWELES